MISLHTEVLGGDECREYEGNDTVDALKHHTDERDARCTNTRVVCATEFISSHLYTADGNSIRFHPQGTRIKAEQIGENRLYNM